MQNSRVRLLKEGVKKEGPVVYWMSRDQRADDNWTLIFAQELALEKKEPLIVVFSLVNRFLGATIRQFDFLLRGLKETEAELKSKNIPFVFQRGLPYEKVIKYTNKINASVLVTDFDPLKIKMEWKEKLFSVIDIPFYEVDAHNIVPVWVASTKPEFGAYTLRPKIQKLLPEYLTEIPALVDHPYKFEPEVTVNDWERIIKLLPVDKSVKPIGWIKPGAKAAKEILSGFIEKKLELYLTERNDPVKQAQSDLSPYLHFGQISSQRIAFEINNLPINNEQKESFLEELIIRKELSDNYCHYCKDYDNFNGFPDWARNSLNEHRDDKREFIYSKEEFEQAKTNDELWNTAQTEMVQKGKMNGYMRMYWAKKILEWTNSPEEAIEIATFLNDKYEIDGRDPNGYAGIAWSIGGVHDRAWGDREIFGKVRYMNYNGCKSKFDVEEYIKKVKG
jgi:deoxyribodipyrimidine photo-lyase